MRDIQSQDKRIVIVGGGLAGLTTAYYLTTQSKHNKVTLLEKERTCGQGSSSHNGGLFLTNNFQPWTEKPLSKILPGFVKVTGPQCAWLSSYFFEPGASKFIYYFLTQQGLGTPKTQRINTARHLMELSEHELNTIVNSIGLDDGAKQQIIRNQNADLFELWELEEPLSKNIDKILSEQAESLALEKHTILKTQKEIESAVFQLFPNYSEKDLHKNNLAIRKRAITLDTGALSQKLIEKLQTMENFTLKCNSEVSNVSYSTNTGLARSVSIMGKLFQEIETDALVVCTGAYTARFLYSTLGVFAPIVPIKSYTFDVPTSSPFSGTHLICHKSALTAV